MIREPAFIIGMVCIAALCTACAVRAHRASPLRAIPVLLIFALATAIFLGLLRYVDPSVPIMEHTLQALTGGFIVLSILFNVAARRFHERHRMLNFILRRIRRVSPDE